MSNIYTYPLCLHDHYKKEEYIIIGPVAHIDHDAFDHIVAVRIASNE